MPNTLFRPAYSPDGAIAMEAGAAEEIRWPPRKVCHPLGKLGGRFEFACKYRMFSPPGGTIKNPPNLTFCQRQGRREIYNEG